MTGENRRKAYLVFYISKVKYFFRILGPWDYSSGCNLVFAGVNFRVTYYF